MINGNMIFFENKRNDFSNYFAQNYFAYSL
jgi:hypothetical protein